MNKILLLSLIGLFILPLGYSALTDGLVAYYNFDETSGTTLIDSYNNYDGTSYLTLVNQPGKIGTSHYFNSTTWINITNLYGNFSTISFWVKDNGSVDNGVVWNIGVDEAHGLRVHMKMGGKGIGYNHNGIAQVQFNEPNPTDWLHIVMVRNNTHIKTYIRGVYNRTEDDANTPGGTLAFGKWPSGTQQLKGWLDEVGIWDRYLTDAEVAELYNSGSGYNPIIVSTISDFNVTLITDNTTWLSGSNSNWSLEFNTTNNILIRTLNTTGSEVVQNITLTTPQISTYATGVNITSGTNISLTFNNISATFYTLNFTNPFNSSVWKTITVNINDVDNITYANTSKFFAINSTKALNFSMYLDSGALTCNDYYNLTIPLAGITNRLVKSCDLTNVWFNNSAVYNYTAYLTNERFGRTINNTYYFYTTVYNLSTPSYNDTISNNTLTDITWYLSTVTGYASSNQSINMSIDFDGVTTYPTASGLNYSYIETAITDEIIETVTFTLYLNLSYDGEYVNFTQPYSLVITTIQIDDCSVYTNQILNITIKNELDRTTLIPYANLMFSINKNGDLLSITITNDTDGIIGICLNNSVMFIADAEFSFDTVVFATENETSTPPELNYGATTKRNREHFYFDTFFTNVPISQSFYKLPTDDAEKIIFKLVDVAQQPLKGYYLTIKRWYGDGYETIAMAKTDVSGQAITYIQYNEPYYAFDVLDENGVLVHSTDRIVLTTTPTTIQVPTDAQDSYWTANGTLGYTNTWSNVTGYFTSTMYGVNSIDMAQFSLLMYYTNGSLICAKYSGSTTSFTTMCLAGSWNTTSFFVKGEAVTTKGNRVLLFNYIVDEVITPASVFEVTEGLMWLGLIMIIMSMAFVGISPSFLPLSPVISLILTNVIGLTSISWMVVAGLGVGGMMFMLWFMRN